MSGSEGHDLFGTHGFNNSDGDFLTFIEGFLDLLHEFLIRGAGLVDFVVIFGEKRKAVALDVDEHVFGLLDDRAGEAVRGGRDIFVLSASEDINGDEGGLSVTVLSGLGNGDVNDFAREALDAHVVTLLDVTSGAGDGVRGTGVNRFEGVVVRHD